MATVCTSCGKSDIIHSRQDWNEVCGNCGLVLRQNIPTDEAEWQNSTGDDNNVDNSRVGISEDSIYFSSNLSNHIKLNSKSSRSTNYYDRLNKKDLKNINLIHKITNLCTEFNLKGKVADTALSLYTKYVNMHDSKRVKEDVLVGCLIYLSCILTNTIRTREFICKGLKISKYELINESESLKSLLNLTLPDLTFKDYINYIGTVMGFSFKEREICKSILENAIDSLEVSFKHPDLAAGAILLTGNLIGKPIKAKDIELSTKINRVQINKVYNELSKNGHLLINKIKEIEELNEKSDFDLIEMLDNL